MGRAGSVGGGHIIFINFFIPKVYEKNENL